MADMSEKPEAMMAEAKKKQDQKQYEAYVKEITPTHNIWDQTLKAFMIGGFICAFGELLMKIFERTLQMETDAAARYTTMTLIFIGVLFTGLNLYQKLTRFAGAGALVPITGFANSVAAPAIEYKAEGHVFGIGAKIFSIAGPVILFGILTSWGLGIIYYLFR